MTVDIDVVFTAKIRNQYGRLLGEGRGDSRDDAIRAASREADAVLREANPRWKWRKTNTLVVES